MEPTNRLDRLFFRVVKAIVDRICRTTGRNNYEVAVWIIGTSMLMWFASCVTLVAGRPENAWVNFLLAAVPSDNRAVDILWAVFRLWFWVLDGFVSLSWCRRLSRSERTSSGTMNLTEREARDLWFDSFLWTVLGLVFFAPPMILWGIGHYAVRMRNGGGKSVLARAKERVASWAARGVSLRPSPVPVPVPV